MSYAELLKLAAPETIVVIAALVALVADLAFLRELETRFRFIIGGMIAGAGCAAASVWLLVLQPHGNAMNGMLVADPLTAFVKIAVLVLAIFTVLLSVGSNFTTHVGEYLALVLFAAVGMMFLVSAEDILMIFISLELTSLSLYILTAFNKRNVKSAEAALKYFLFGGMAAAFTLFGLSLLYGFSGATNLGQIAGALKGKGLDPLLIVAIVMTVIGFGFKVAAVPFHLWAPDAYEGAPTPSAAFIASGSKVASFFIFAKVMLLGFAGAEGSGAWRNFMSGWVPVIAIVAALSMVLGNLAAIVQSSVRRLIAYSAIAHAGYMLLAVLSHDKEAVASLLYYAVTYGLTTIGAFGVVSVVEDRAGDDKLSSFAGLSRRLPVISFCMMIFMLSLAGIPPLAGFFGKFYVFAAAIKTGAPNLGLLWLVILALAMSAVSLYYYLQVLKQIYVADVPAGATEISAPVLSQFVLSLLAAGVVLFGCVPNLLVGVLQRCVAAAGL
ncbi:MAG: NADH-quinone oxidoreductase subunit N [Verrucomicrobia bacterium]|jgi:NADH-quinone oxidoreductase subunit N|nr:NADH-quinone oxidoreductase subunit N [Verrucomicrobiota bacterium]